MIPRTIHQTWRSHEVPPEWQAYSSSWSTFNPGWARTLWTDDDCRSLVADVRPSLLALFDAYPLGIQRADAFRYVLLAAHGGLYVDLDFECLRPIGPLLDDDRVIVGLEPVTHANDTAVRSRGLSQIVCNAFMASPPGHRFWEHVLDRMATYDPAGPVLDTTGVFMLSEAVATYPRPEELRVVASDLLYPVSKWEVWGVGVPAESVQERLDAAFAVHHWSSSWQRDRLRNVARDLAARRAARDR